MLCHVFWSQVEYKIVCFISLVFGIQTNGMLSVAFFISVVHKDFNFVVNFKGRFPQKRRLAYCGTVYRDPL